MSLNGSQQAAVERLGQDVCVVAGPGSGKTRVLIERFRWLVEKQGIPPRRILAITFTEKAATEIKKRLVGAFAGSPAVRRDIERAYVSTIHGFCMRLLKENAVAARVDPEFELLDEADSKYLQRVAVDGALDELFARQPKELSGLMRGLQVSSTYGMRQEDIGEAILRLYEAARTAGTPIDVITGPEEVGNVEAYPELLDACRRILKEPFFAKTVNQREEHAVLAEWAARFLELPPSLKMLGEFRARLNVLVEPQKSIVRKVRELIPEVKAQLTQQQHEAYYPVLLGAFQEFHRRYGGMKRERAALDFSDLEEGAIRLLVDDEGVRKRIVESFDQVLMDELQDTNRVQWALMELIRRPGRFFAVGDINQSIYGFRYADPEVFREYRVSLSAEGNQVDELRENYRSRVEILELANRVFAGTPGVEPHRLEAGAKFEASEGAVIEALWAYGTGGEDAAEIEAAWVAKRIREMAERVPLEEIAVLTRSVAALEPIQGALDGVGVPWIVSGGRSFYEAREVRDLTAYLAVLANPRDEVQLATVLRSPLVGVRDQTLWEMKQRGKLFEVLEGECPEELEEFWTRVKQQREGLDGVSPDRLLARVVDETSYEEGLEERARANIEKLYAQLRERYLRAPAPLAEIVEGLAWRRKAETEAEAPPGDASRAVRLMTVHAAKGLEYRAVFLPAMQRGVDTRTPALFLTPEEKLGVAWRDAYTGKASPDPVYRKYETEIKAKEEGEEQRLLYVAMTRAKEYLWLSASGSSHWWKLAAEGLGVEAKPAEREQWLEDRNFRVTGVRPESVLPRWTETVGGEVRLVERARVERKGVSAAAVTEIGAVEVAYRGEARGGAEFGTAVHAVLAGEEGEDREAADLAATFATSGLGQRAARAERVEREFDFVMAVDDVVVQGQIDLWFVSEGRVVVVDYKTDQVEEGAEGERAKAYGTQVRLYAMAVEKVAGRKVDEAWVFFLRRGVAIAVGLTEEEKAGTRELVRSWTG